MLKQLLTRVKGSDFLRNSLTLSGGVALAQVLPFLFYPLLGRIFTTEEFGLFATLTSITSVMAVFGSGKYELGILVADNKLEAANLAVLSIVIGLVTMLLSWVVCQFLLIDQLSTWLKEPNLGHWIYVCPLAAFFIIVFNTYNEWCVREKYFMSLSVNKIVNAGAVVLGKTFLGFVKISSQGLVVGDLVGRGISAAGCLLRALLKDGKTFFMTSWRGMCCCVTKFREFPFYTMPGRLLNTLGQSMPVLFLAVYFNKSEVGLFSTALMLFSVPASVISNSIGDVYRQHANDEYRQQGNCIASFDKILKTLTLIGVVGCLAVVWFLPTLMRLFMGPQWTMAGVYAQYIAPAMVLSFLANSLSGLFIVTDHLKAFFWWQVYYAFVNFLAMWLGGWLIGTMQGTLVLYTVLLSSAYLLSIILTRRYAKGSV